MTASWRMDLYLGYMLASANLGPATDHYIMVYRAISSPIIRPHLAHRDMHFFTNAKERGWIYVTKFTPKPFKYVILLIVFTRLSE